MSAASTYLVYRPCSYIQDACFHFICHIRSGRIRSLFTYCQLIFFHERVFQLDMSTDITSGQAHKTTRTCSKVLDNTSAGQSVGDVFRGALNHWSLVLGAIRTCTLVAKTTENHGFVMQHAIYRMANAAAQLVRSQCAEPSIPTQPMSQSSLCKC